MSTLKDRILEVQNKMSWSDTQTAKAAGVSRSAVAQWAGKGSKIIHTVSDVEAVLNLERETGFSALWIAKGKGPKTVDARRIADHWPFRDIDAEKVGSLKAHDKSKLEAAILIAAAQVGVDVKKDG